MVRLVFRPIPKSDERFARQIAMASTRVSLASPARHSSPSFGPDRHAHTQPFSLLVRVSRRVEWGAHRPTPEHADAEARREARAADHDKAATPPLAPFHLYSRTCSPSVSPIFSLDGIYRPIGAAFPNNPTQTAPWCDRVRHDGLSPLWRPFQGTWARSAAEDAPDYTNAKTPDFQAGLFPAFDQTIDDLTRIEFTTACQDALASLARILANRARNTRRPASVRYPREDWGRRFVTPRQTCLARRLGAQLALKDSMVHGFCNSHQVSISPRSSSMRAEISAVESL
ncbi:hypothetical protein Bca4012_102684 [Brassica carinata]